jgi:beta-lactamase regulating signal transducer with metallopeptidase domain/peroxiredoxin
MNQSWSEMLVDLPVMWDLGLRITALLSFAWIVHFVLVKSNPRWRVQLWRFTSLAVVAISLSIFMPKYSLSVSPADEFSDGFAGSIMGVGNDPGFEIQMNEPTLAGSGIESDKDYKYFVSALKPETASTVMPVVFSEETPKQSFASMLKENWRLVLFVCWGMGVFVISLRWLTAQIRIRKLLSKSVPAPENYRQGLDRIANQLEIADNYELRFSNETDVPFVAGLYHPVIILPECMLAQKYCNELPAIFSHELTHVKSNDLLWMGVSQWVSILFWFHPLAWNLRKAHSMACEEVADTVAADVVGDVTSYSGILARIALEAIIHPPAVAAMSMARSPEIISRLRRLRQGLSNLPLTRRSLVLTAVIGFLALAPLATINFAYADLKTESVAGKEKFVPGRVLEFPENKSVGMLEIMFDKDRDYYYRFFRPIDYHNGPQANWKYFAEAKGKVTVPKGARVKLTVRKAGAKNMAWVKKLKPDDLYDLAIIPYKGNQNPYKFGDQQAKYISHLTGLVVLEMRPVQVTDKGMKFVESLQSLKSLTTYSPVFGNETLKSISKLESLELLSTGNGKWDDKGLAYLSNLKSIEQLYLPCFDEPGPGFDSLTSVPTLKYINGGLFKDSHLEYLKGATQLKSLSLAGNENINNDSLVHLSHLVELENLNLRGTNVTDEGLVHLKPLRSLKDLHLRVNGRREGLPITGKGCEILSEMPSLEILHFAQFGNVNEGLKHLSKLPNLKSLWFGHLAKNTYLNETGLKYLSKMITLERLVLGGWGSRLDKNGLSYISELTNLKFLVLECSFDLTNEDFARLQPLVNLKYFSINAYNKEHDITLPALNHLNSLYNLEAITAHLKPTKEDDEPLNLSGLSKLEYFMVGNLRDQDLPGFANCTNMRNLQIGHKSQFSNAGLSYLSNLNSVERLSISGKGITDEGLIHLTNMKQLKSLWLKGNLTDKGLKKLGKMKSLHTVSVTTESKISTKATKQLYNILPNVIQFNVKEGVIADWNRNKGFNLKNLKLAKKRLKTGQVAPAFKLASMKGKEMSIEKQHGKVTLLYFWSTTCKPCVASMSTLNEAFKELSKFDDFAMIGLSADSNNYLFRKFLKKHKVTWPQIRVGEDSKVAAAYGVIGYPRFFLIGRDGKILHVGQGKGLDNALRKALEIKVEKSN